MPWARFSDIQVNKGASDDNRLFCKKRKALPYEPKASWKRVKRRVGGRVRWMDRRGREGGKCKARGARKKGASLFWRTSKLRSQRERRSDRERRARGSGVRDGRENPSSITCREQMVAGWLARSLAHSLARLCYVRVRFYTVLLRLVSCRRSPTTGARWLETLFRPLPRLPRACLFVTRTE